MIFPDKQIISIHFLVTNHPLLNISSLLVRVSFISFQIQIKMNTGSYKYGGCLDG
jgi:hypothetical protein